MIILIISIAVLTGGIVLVCLEITDWSWGLGWFMTFLSGVALFVSVIALPVKYYEAKEKVIQYQVYNEEIKEARINKANIERYGILKEIMEYNAWVARAKYYNSTIWGIWIPDFVESMKLLEVKESE